MTSTHHADFAIVGSGAGGSVLAYNLARQGHSVLVLERGPYVRPPEMNHDELGMIAKLYKEGGSQTNTEADMFLLQGECVGGSTVLTNAVCFRMPEEVRHSFGRFGFDIPADELQAAHERVESVLNVHRLDRNVHNPATPLLAEGIRRADHVPGEFDKCMLHCIGCGYCNVGCRYGRKLDALTTWVPMAEAHGAKVLAETEVLKVEHRRGAVRGLLCRDRRDGSAVRVTADRYVLAGGALNTPELLLRSKLGGPRVGTRASFNAGAIVFGEFEQPLDAYHGDQMCVWTDGPGYIIEQIHNPPTSFALTMPGWFAEHQERMRGYRNMTALGVLVPTQPVGKVYLGIGHKVMRRLFDHADVRFRLPEEDLEAFRRGFTAAAHIFLESGARVAVPPLATNTEVRSHDDLPLVAKHLRDQKDILGFGSSHPQGGACLGDDPDRDVVAPDFRVRGTDNLFVVDASLFPHSVRVNPMLSIMAVADYAVRFVSGTPAFTSIEEGPAWTARQKDQSAQEAS